MATYNPLARLPEDEERARLQEQPLPPVEEADATEAGGARRRPGQDAETLRAETSERPVRGSLVDSYA